MTKRTAGVVVALAALQGAALGQVPAGPEFRVNTYTTGHKFSAFVASQASGDFVVAWTSYGQDGSASGNVFGQRFSAAGEQRGAEFMVNTFTPDAQFRPSIASDANG